MAPLSAGKFALSKYRLIVSPVQQLSYVQTRTYADEPKPLTTTELSNLKRGRGGRSSFSGIVATIFGASGFVGRYVVNALGKIGTQMILPYRGDHSDVIRLKLCGDLGQVLYAPFNLRDEESIAKAVKYSNVVINLIGRDFQTRNFSYDDVNVEGARTIARIARQSGVKTLIHLSSMNVGPKFDGVIQKGGSKFLVSKYHGEAAVREEFPEAIIIRPAEMYGNEDRYLCYYAHGFRLHGRWLPLWNKGAGIFKQPICVNDVARAIINAISDKTAVGKTFQAVGPSKYELGELVDWFYKVMRKDDGDWGYKLVDMKYLPTFWLQVMVSDKFAPSLPILIWDKMEREHTTDRVDKKLPSIEDLGVKLTHIEDHAPWLLRPYRAYAYYIEDLGEFPTPPSPRVVSA